MKTLLWLLLIIGITIFTLGMIFLQLAIKSMAQILH